MEGIRQLAVYSYATSKTTKSEARTMAIKALRFPDSVKHLEEEPSDKAMALGREEVERIFQARYEQSILKNVVGRQQQSLNHNNRGFGRQQRYTRGRGTFHRSFFGRSKGPKLQSTPIRPPSTLMPSPATTAHYIIPSDGILPGGRLQCFSEQWKRTILHS
ncbi:hypothetical protein RMATCC62417_01727 [Rhizopus microsporus]|nr:hypothetical protein RMATCC62417_01727 [Rhizopus microsporus]